LTVAASKEDFVIPDFVPISPVMVELPALEMVPPVLKGQKRG
jgi:hypothetical protein